MICSRMPNVQSEKSESIPPWPLKSAPVLNQPPFSLTHHLPRYHLPKLQQLCSPSPCSVAQPTLPICHIFLITPQIYGKDKEQQRTMCDLLFVVVNNLAFAGGGNVYVAHRSGISKEEEIVFPDCPKLPTIAKGSDQQGCKSCSKTKQRQNKG